jgi:hypothetical protein
VQQSILCNKLEDIEKQIKEINQTIKTFTGTINPPHRPLKDIDVSGIIELVESGVSARVVAKRLGVTTNTVTTRLEKAEYGYINGKWRPKKTNLDLDRIKEIIKKIQNNPSPHEAYIFVNELKTLARKRYTLSSNAMIFRPDDPKGELSSTIGLFKSEIGRAIKQLGFEDTEGKRFIIDKKENHASRLQNVLTLIGEDGLNTVDCDKTGKLTKRVNLNNR